MEMPDSLYVRTLEYSDHWELSPIHHLGGVWEREVSENSNHSKSRIILTDLERHDNQ
jgi:hypothetical protein